MGSRVMTSDEVELLRRLALHEPQAVHSVMCGDQGELLGSLDQRSAALARIVALLSVDSDPSTVRWGVDMGIAAGVEDSEVVDALMVVAPIIGTARITSAIESLLEALGIDLIED